MAYAPLTPKEEAAIADLERLAKKWPKNLWLYSASGTLNVMKTPPDGNEMLPGDGGGVDPENIVTIIPGIRNDGGDW